MDTILLAEMAFFAHHGERAEERALGQRFLVDLEVDADLGEAAERDDLSETVDYSELFRATQAAFESPPCRLIEAAAERVARAILNGFPRVQVVRVQVRKPFAPIAGAMFSHAAVRIERRRIPGEEAHS